MEPLYFENVPNNGKYDLERARVIGGWILRETIPVMTPVNTGYTQPEMLTGYEWRIAMTFIPDPNHEWV